MIESTLVREVKKLRKLKDQKAFEEVEPEYFIDDRPIQLVTRTKPRFIQFFRAKPVTAYRPTGNQIKARLRFAELAKRAKGEKFKKGEKFVRCLPPAAESVKEMSGEKFGRTEKVRKWEKVLSYYLD